MAGGPPGGEGYRGSAALEVQGGEATGSKTDLRFLH